MSRLQRYTLHGDAIERAFLCLTCEGDSSDCGNCGFSFDGKVAKLTDELQARGMHAWSHAVGRVLQH